MDVGAFSSVQLLSRAQLFATPWTPGASLVAQMVKNLPAMQEIQVGSQGQCDEHWGTRVSFPSGFLSVYGQQWDCWIIRQFYFQFFKESPHCSP